MVDELFELVVGEEGFVIELRCDNRYNEEKYSEIKKTLYFSVRLEKTTDNF